MTTSLPAISEDLPVQALHALREQLVEKYNGDIHTYAQACECKIQSLGITFKRLPEW
jgi:hypothetical protein